MARPKFRRRNFLINRAFQVRWSLLIALTGTMPAALFAGFMWVSIDEYNAALRGSIRDEIKARETLVEAAALMGELREKSRADGTRVAGKLGSIAELYASGRSTKTGIIENNETTQIWVMGIPLIILILLWFCGVFVTHKVAGPLYVVKVQLDFYKKNGSIQKRALRGGDEFQEVYDSLVAALGKDES